MKKTIKSMKLEINSQIVRNLRNDALTAAVGGIVAPSLNTRCHGCDSFTVPVTRCV